MTFHYLSKTSAARYRLPLPDDPMGNTLQSPVALLTPSRLTLPPVRTHPDEEAQGPK
jgi:hypothetical protein